MKAFLHRPLGAAIGLALAGSVALAGCGRDTRVNSDPGTGRTSSADSGEATVQPDPNQAAPAKGGTHPSTGTDSTGRPGDASGGTTAAGAGSGTSGTADPTSSSSRNSK
jgi:hypothetical protein